MTHAWIATACLMTVPVEVVQTDSVAVAELNTLYDDAGSETIERDSLLFVDGNTIRRVRFKVWLPTFSQYDRELDERQHWPQEQRRRLSEPVRRK